MFLFFIFPLFLSSVIYLFVCCVFLSVLTNLFHDFFMCFFISFFISFFLSFFLISCSFVPYSRLPFFLRSSSFDLYFLCSCFPLCLFICASLFVSFFPFLLFLSFLLSFCRSCVLSLFLSFFSSFFVSCLSAESHFLYLYEASYVSNLV